MSGGRARRRAADGLSQQRQPGCTSPPSWGRPIRRGATLERSLSETATAPPRAIFVGRDGRTQALGAERRLTPLPAQLRRVQLHGSQMGPKAAPAAASWRLWGSLERRRRCAFATWAYTTSRGGSSCERWSKARAGCWGLARAPVLGARSLDTSVSPADDELVLGPSRFMLAEAGKGRVA